MQLRVHAVNTTCQTALYNPTDWYSILSERPREASSRRCHSSYSDTRCLQVKRQKLVPGLCCKRFLSQSFVMTEAILNTRVTLITCPSLSLTGHRVSSPRQLWRTKELRRASAHYPASSLITSPAEGKPKTEAIFHYTGRVTALFLHRFTFAAAERCGPERVQYCTVEEWKNS